MALIPPSSQTGFDQLPAEHGLWCHTINGWVKDPSIRRDALIAFGMLLATAIILVWITFHFGGNVLSEIMESRLSATIENIVALGIAAITGASVWGGILLRRRNRRSAMS